jgi:molybdopterin converting factor small subunit
MKALSVTVKLYGSLRRLSSPGSPGLWKGKVPQGSTILELVSILGTTEKELAGAALNDQVCELTTKIADGDTITLVTPVGGG